MTDTDTAPARAAAGPDSVADFTDVIWINTTSSERQFPF